MPPETLITQPLPFLSKLACEATCRGAGYCSSCLAADELRNFQTGELGQPFLRHQSGHDGQIHHVAKLAEGRIFAGELFELGREIVGPLLGDRVALAGVLIAAAAGGHHVLLGHALHTLAANLPGERILVAAERLVVRREPPTRHEVLQATAAAEHGQVAGQAVDRRRFEVHAEPLHAEVGGHEDAGEVARLRHAGDGDRLRAEGFFILSRGDLRIVLGGDGGGDLLQPLQTFGRRIDRAADAG